MDNAFMRSEPAELLFIGHRLLPCTEVPHDFFDFQSDKLPRIELRRRADQVGAMSQRKGEAGSGPPFIVLQQRRGVGIDRILVDGVAAMARADRIAGVPR